MEFTKSGRVNVKIISDVICPWCYVGASNLEKAVLDSGVDVNITWGPYFLNKSTPPQGEDLLEHLSKKYGPHVVARFNRPDNPLDLAGQKVGISFNKARRIIPTQKCHQLMEFINQKYPEKGHSLMKILFKKYHEEAKDISNDEIIIAAALECDIPEGEVRDALHDPSLLSTIEASDERAKRSLKVSGVPYFIFENNKGGPPITFSGAQPPEIIAEALQMSL